MTLLSISKAKANSYVLRFNEKRCFCVLNLRYHYLRREDVSRLFEKGYLNEEAVQVTSHRNLNVLWQVYAQLFPHKLHGKA